MKHVSVCICAYKRPELLRQLLTALGAQKTDGRFTYSVVVADNDHLESARPIVADVAATARIPIRYCVEPQQSIALARNKAIEHATGHYVAFVDDDEEPLPDWLVQLFEAIESYQADGVLGPVIPRFLSSPPEWLLRGRFFDRPSPPTGTWLRWKETRTGNVLLGRQLFDDPRARFRPECGRGGEDLDFFRRMMADGKRFVWCAEARVSEAVPAERSNRSYLLKRAVLRGQAPTTQEWRPVLVSLVAVPTYALALPVLFVFGQHVFMRYLIKVCEHIARLLTFVGLKW